MLFTLCYVLHITKEELLPLEFYFIQENMTEGTSSVWESFTVL